ncbi:MAG: DUF2779 domain-containing protein [Candidatus Micrarchaeota archaeon]|nr:DUF2779 domain-containing protein [Candidatus Micrarchaeota archaeon]
MPKKPHKKFTYLTKSRYITGLKCSKELWLSFNRPEDLPEADGSTQRRFDEGNLVGELAKSLFPKGIDIKERIPLANDRLSRELLLAGKPLFEAGFIHPNGLCYARADILVPAGGSLFDLLEVKSSTSIKEYHLEDIAFQKHCYEGAGLAIRRCFVLHVNNQYKRMGKIDPHAFFTKADVTEEVAKLYPTVPGKIKRLLKITKLKKCPEFGHGEAYHDDPTGVHENDKFWKEHPDMDILHLHRGGSKAIEMLNSGIYMMKDILDHDGLSDKQKIQHKVHQDGNHHIDHKEIAAFLGKLEYPLCFLDFESYATAIPLYDGLRPYQAIPFQFSVHILPKEGASLKHKSFIASGSKDPRKRFLAALKRAIGAKGTIVVYNQSFEQGVLKALGEEFPKEAKWVEGVNLRMVDLLAPFRNFHYYHPHQKGKISLKQVLPALTGKNYDDFEIGNGQDAQLSYLYITHGASDGKKASIAEKRKIRTHLEKYCGQDTEGMVWIVEKLMNLSEN